ncbi:MAG: polysaccharide biosynthesis C-terminal domain-containing protein [Oscillospiraceae bacterium]|nr:polysaccharide biosynthesis C-terminal domain-containing protein [Oscillospiraceae bacterium]
MADNKYKKLMNNTMIFGIGQVFAKIVGFLLVALYTRFMTEKEYSTATLVYNTVNLLVPLVTFSMADAVIRFGMDKTYDKRKVFTSANFALLMGMGVFMLASPLVSLNAHIGKYALLLYIYCYFSCFRQIASQFVRARNMVRLFILDGILTTITQLICNCIFIIGLKMSVTGYILSFIISDGLSLVFLTLMGSLWKYADTKFYDRQLFREMLGFSVWLIPTYMLWWVTSSSDQWFVVSMIGETENGIYAAAYKLPTLLMLVTTMFYQAWQMSSIEERNSKGLGKFYQNVFSAYSSLLFLAAAGLIMLVKPLTFILTSDGSNGTRYYEAYMFTPILIISMVFQCMCQFLSSVYTTTKRSRNSLWTALFAAVPNIIMNFILIKPFGVWGAAAATALSYCACFAVRLWDVRHYIRFYVNIPRLVINSVLLILMTVAVGVHGKLWVMWLIILFILSAVMNFGAVIRTLKRILNRGRKPASAQLPAQK